MFCLLFTIRKAAAATVATIPNVIPKIKCARRNKISREEFSYCFLLERIDLFVYYLISESSVLDILPSPLLMSCMVRVRIRITMIDASNRNHTTTLKHLCSNRHF